jgi:ABC-type glycerol-3-phosphate transport system substrate-binding protein
MSLPRNQIIVLSVAGGVILILALVFLGILPGLQNKAQNPQNIKATLNFWGVDDPSSAYGAAIKSFNATYKNVTVNYRSFPDPQTYGAAVLNALASGQGPDIFMVPNTNLQAEIAKITPVSQTQFSVLNLQQLFPPVVAQDFVSGGQIYGLPLSIDTLALIYNRSLFDAAGVPLPASWQSWDDFVANVPKLIQKDAGGNIIQAAAAIGGTNDNIDHASDLLALIFLQNGVALDSRAGSFSLNSQAAQNALAFYAQFATPGSTAYTWNASLPNSLAAFAQGRVAMVFGYESAIPQIKSQNQFLKLETAMVPQPKGIQNPVAYPSYWAYVVSKQSANAALAWNFILNMTTNQTNAAAYVTATGKPPALNAVIYNEESDPILSPFARQALIAKSWYEADPASEAQIFSQMVQSVISGSSTIPAALSNAQNQIYQLTQNQNY